MVFLRSGRILTADVEVAVCTIEKANILINQIVDDSSVGVDPMQLSMIVVDELHLVSDSKRGFLLEVLLSKARFIWGDHIQIIGMSATLPNLGDIAKWLQGVLYCTQYRPVELKTAICVDRRLYDPSPELPFNGQWGEKIPPIGTIRPLQEWIIDPNLLYQCSMTSTKSNINVPKLKEFSSSPSYLKAKNYLKSADPDGLISLSVETVLQDKKSVVVFCPSKNWCDRAAVIISDALSILRELESDSTGFALSTSFANESRDFEDSVIVNKSFCMQKISDEKIRTERCRTLVFNLLQCPVGICPILEKSLLQGVAYHHAGLTMDERKIIEKGFRDGIITVLCATSTLAAGVC